MYASILRMWKKHLINEAGVDKAVKLGWITEDQAEKIKATPR